MKHDSNTAHYTEILPEYPQSRFILNLQELAPESFARAMVRNLEKVIFLGCPGFASDGPGREYLPLPLWNNEEALRPAWGSPVLSHTQVIRTFHAELILPHRQICLATQSVGLQPLTRESFDWLNPCNASTESVEIGANAAKSSRNRWSFCSLWRWLSFSGSIGCGTWPKRNLVNPQSAHVGHKAACCWKSANCLQRSRPSKPHTRHSWWGNPWCLCLNRRQDSPISKRQSTK